MKDSMTRSKAADKLLKKLPEEEDPGTEDAAPEMPPEMASAPAAEDAAPALADAGLPPSGPEPDADDMGAGSPPADIDSALAGVEAAIEGMPEDAAREIRTHLEAIKDIVSQNEQTSAPPMPGDTAQSDVPTPDTMPPAAPMGTEERP